MAKITTVRSHNRLRNTTRQKTKYPKARILVADDSAVNREVVEQALRQFSITPDFAQNGHEALESIGSKSYDLVFMDCNMPEMDGFQATAKIRESLPDDKLPIVALTAHLVGDIAEKVKTSGMNDILVKPFTMASLAGALDQWLPFHLHGDGHFAAKELSPQAAVKSPSLSAINIGTTSDAEIYSDELLQNLREITGDAFEQTFTQLKKLFHENAPAVFSQLQAAFAANDNQQIAKAAHALKSMSLNIGAKLLGDSLLVLEIAEPEQDLLVEYTIAEQQYLAVMRSIETVLEDEDQPRIPAAV